MVYVAAYSNYSNTVTQMRVLMQRYSLNAGIKLLWYYISNLDFWGTPPGATERPVGAPF